MPKKQPDSPVDPKARVAYTGIDAEIADALDREEMLRPASKIRISAPPPEKSFWKTLSTLFSCCGGSQDEEETYSSDPRKMGYRPLSGGPGS